MTEHSAEPLPDQQEDYLPRKPIWAGVATIVVVTLGGLVLVYFIGRAFPQSMPDGFLAPIWNERPIQVDGTEQWLFRERTAGESPDILQREQRLQQFGWVDRQRGLVHIPIADAMDLRAAEGRRTGAPVQPDEPAIPQEGPTPGRPTEGLRPHDPQLPLPSRPQPQTPRRTAPGEPGPGRLEVPQRNPRHPDTEQGGTPEGQP